MNTSTEGGESDSTGRNDQPNNNLQPLPEEEQHQQQEEDSSSTAAQESSSTAASSTAAQDSSSTAALQPLAPPPLAATMTSVSSGSSSSGRRRLNGVARRRASSGSVGSRGLAAAAACLPRDDNLYDSLVRFQEENDDSTTVSMGETLRSVSTWYSVQTDDDRKIPARPSAGTFEGTYREPIRRPYRFPARGSTGGGGRATNGNNSNSGSSASGGSSNSSSNSSGSSNTPGLANFNPLYPRVAAGARYPPPEVAARRTSSGSMSRSDASGPPPVVWEEEEKDDHTAISSLANNTADRSEEDQSILTALARFPLGGIDEGCAMGAGNNTSNELNAAAQETNMGNMEETTRSAPTPSFGGAAAGVSRFPGNPGGPDWDSVEWAFPNLVSSNDAGEAHQPSSPRESCSSDAAGGDCSPMTASTPSMGPSSPARTPTPPTPPPPANDFTIMQQTLGMQDLCVPGSTNPSPNGSNPSLTGSEQPPTPGPSLPSMGSSQGTLSSNNPVEPPTSKNSSDPAAQEQYQIWQQIQAEQERKQMELALQLSQEATTRSDTSLDGFVYPSQDEEKPEDAELDEEEALKVALRLSEEEAAGGGGGNPDDEEDEIELALRLSKEQAEADQKRLQEMQEREQLSEEEQLRLAMEQSMNQSEPPRPMTRSAGSSLPQHKEEDEGDEEMRRALAESLQRSEHGDIPEGSTDGMDEEMALALRLSQAQLEEEELFRQSFLQPKAAEDPAESFHQMNQPYPGGPSTSRHGASPELDDTEIVPPVRSRPSEEPASPGLTPLGQGRDGQVRGRRMMGGRGGGPPPDKMDIPGAIPPYRPSLQDRESLSDGVRESFEQQQMKEIRRDMIRSGAHPAKVHGPDDGSDMPPVSRPLRKDQSKTIAPRISDAQKDQTKTRAPCSSEAQVTNVVDIDRDSRDLLVREGQSETRAAIMQGHSQIVTCRGCFGKLHAPMNCSLVFCPTCNTVSTVARLGV